MDGQHRGALPHTAGQTGETIQVHRDVCCDAENRSRPPHCQLLLLGHFCGRKLHRQMGKPHHVLCGQCVCCSYCIAHTHTHTHTHTQINDHHHHQRRPALCSCEQQGATKCHSPCPHPVLSWKPSPLQKRQQPSDACERHHRTVFIFSCRALTLPGLAYLSLAEA